MFKRILQKANVHRSDHLRAILSDTMPGDIPIIVSNDGIYKNLKSPANVHPNIIEFASKIFQPTRAYTVPYRYNILHTSGGTRRLSLIHPAAQLAVADFYRDAGHLLCYYARRSQATLRAPHKMASLFFIRGPASEKNVFKGSDIDTVSIEKAVANPASFFAYRGYSRAYQFFASADYLRLEKKYRSAITTDISKCFSGIYTHTLYWAIVSTLAGKENTRSDTFSNRFDKIMQSMNFNETNGICVGAEVSRIFAEIILGEIDRRIIADLSTSSIPIKYKSEYEFFRYVDDYYIFAQDPETAARVMAAISSNLSSFNLHLSVAKTHFLERPFITSKSRIIRDADINLNNFCNKFLASAEHEGRRYVCPAYVWRSGSLLRSFLEAMKAACFDHATNYQSSSDYIISALSNRVANMLGTYETAKEAGSADLRNYLPAILLLLEALFFFYNVNPTVSSSHKLARSAILASRFMRNYVPDHHQMLMEQIVRWTNQILHSLYLSSSHIDQSCVPLEILNVLLVVGELDTQDVNAHRVISEFCSDIHSSGYFEIVTYLHCIKDHVDHEKLRSALFKRARELIANGLGLQVDAESAHLALDLLACPYLDRTRRASFFNNMRMSVGLPVLPSAEALIAVEACEATPWFVNWKETDLLRLIRKKELSTVY